MKTKTSNKSADEYRVHPTMFKHAGMKFIHLLLRLVNTCLDQKQWIKLDGKVMAQKMLKSVKARGKRTIKMLSTYARTLPCQLPILGGLWEILV